MSEPPKLFLATANPGKAREFRALLPQVEVVTLAEHPLEMPDETDPTFEGNAASKAEHIVRSLGLAAIADDSGLEVDALGGAPGVRSARYAPGTDEDRYLKLIEAMKGQADRTARFVCAMALAQPGAETVVVRGTCEGHIAEAPSGEGGFGYDPVFLVEPGRTMATLSREEKNAVSHRAAALKHIGPHLDALLRAART